jgi:two-component system cell cycle sensor histidine kinase/response regulator CckA
MLGYSSDEIEFSLEQWRDLIHPEDRDAALQSIEDHLAGRSGFHRLEYRMRTKAGGYKWILDQAKVVSRNPAGEPIRMSGTQTDMTAGRLAEEEREELAGQLRQSQKMEAVGQLAGGIAHDFNNLLQVILGYGGVALDAAADAPGIRGPIEEVLVAGERAKKLVSQLLAFSRQQVIDMQDVNLNSLVPSLMEMIRRVIGAHITLDIVPGHALGTVHADQGQFEQILMNLCVNARDAMPAGGTITIETENVFINTAYCNTHTWARPGRFVLLSVTDTGCGMTPDVIDKVFDPFFTTKASGAGTGLGLSTVYGVWSCEAA